MTVQEIKRSVPLTDIPGRLRDLADRIERGLLSPDLALVVFRYTYPSTSTTLSTHCYGDYRSTYECNGILLHAATGSGDFANG